MCDCCSLGLFLVKGAQFTLFGYLRQSFNSGVVWHFRLFYILNDGYRLLLVDGLRLVWDKLPVPAKEVEGDDGKYYDEERDDCEKSDCRGFE